MLVLPNRCREKGNVTRHKQQLSSTSDPGRPYRYLDMIELYDSTFCRMCRSLDSAHMPTPEKEEEYEEEERDMNCVLDNGGVEGRTII